MIHWAGARLRAMWMPSEADGIVRRLGDELCRLLAEGGGAVELPW